MSRAHVLPALTLLTGCVEGPHFESLGLPRVEPPPGRVVVAPLYYQTKPPRDGASPAEPGPRSIGVDDISLPAASYLSSIGVPARAGSEGQDGVPSSGELLVRGYLVNDGPVAPVGAILASTLTAAVFGGILPYPIAASARCRFRYQLNVVAPGGETLFSKRGTVDADYEHRWFWTLLGQECRSNEVTTEAEMHLFEELGRAFERR